MTSQQNNEQGVSPDNPKKEETKTRETKSAGPDWSEKRDGVRVSSWTNVSKNGKRYKAVRIERNYKDNDGAWRREAMTLFPKHVLIACALLLRADQHLQRERLEGRDAERAKRGLESLGIDHDL